MCRQIANKSSRWMLLVPLLLTISGASGLNWAWLVPGGGVQLDRTALESGKFCALTFDDGPDRMYTAEIGRILERAGVPGTFFVLGENVAEYPEEIAALVAAGHEIASHSWSHPDFTRSDASTIERELAETNAELAKLGVTPRWFRPPYGAYNRSTVSRAAGQGLQTILWSVDPRDWSTPGVEVIVNRVLEGAQPGAVILLHSTNPQTVAALPWIIDGLRDDGYELVTVSEWARLAGGGEPRATPRDIRPSAPPGAEPLAPELPGGPGSEPAALKVISNFSGTRELGLVLNRRTASRDLYRFSYAASPRAPMIEPLDPAAAALFVAVMNEAAEMPRTAVPADAAAMPDTPVADEYPMLAAELPEVLAATDSWQFADAIDTSVLDEPQDGPIIPGYYLIKSAGGGWSGSASINRLLAEGRFTGVLVASEFNLTGALQGLIAPSALYSVARLDPRGVVNLSRQDTGAVLRWIANGGSAVCITFSPEQLAAYRETGDPGSIRYLPEFLLLRAATTSLRTTRTGSSLVAGGMPQGVSGAEFSDGELRVLALRGTSVPADIVLNRPESTLYLTTLSPAGSVECTQLTGEQLVLGDELVLVSNRPLLEP